MEKENKYTISVFTENRIGLLNRITIIFTRRRMNIEDLTVCESELKGVHRYTISIRSTRVQAEKLTAQVLRLVDVLKAFLHDENETVSLELALYKLKTDPELETRAERLAIQHEARVLERNPDFLLLGKTGSRSETQALLEQLRPLGVLEFSRSGPVVITRPMKPLSEYLEEMDRITNAPALSGRSWE